LQLRTGSTNTYTYDTLNRLSNLSSTLTGGFGFGYDALSPPHLADASERDHDELRLRRPVAPAERAAQELGHTTLDGATYTYDNAGTG